MLFYLHTIYIYVYDILHTGHKIHVNQFWFHTSENQFPAHEPYLLFFKWVSNLCNSFSWSGKLFLYLLSWVSYITESEFRFKK